MGLKTIGGSSLLVPPDEYERLKTRLNETQNQTRYLQSMIGIRDQELDRARKVSPSLDSFLTLHIKDPTLTSCKYATFDVHCLQWISL